MHKKLEILWKSASSECETCGPSCADGALVKLGGEELLDLIPLADCFGGQDYDQKEVFIRVLNELGYEVSEDWELDDE